MTKYTDLQAAYENALSIIHESYLACHSQFSRVDLSGVSTALQQLSACISSDYIFVNYIGEPRYDDAFNELCSIEPGREAVCCMADALLNLPIHRYDIGGKHGVDPASPDIRFDNQADANRMCELIEMHEKHIRQRSVKLSQMFDSFIASALHKENTQPQHDYQRALNLLIKTFRSHPFSLKQYWGKRSEPIPYSLTILNNRGAAFLGGDMIRQPCFRQTSQAGVAWIRDELIESKMQRRAGTIPGRNVILELLRKVHTCATEATKFKLRDTTWSDSFAPVTTCLDAVIEAVQNVMDADSSPRRYAVCGQVNVGKSSVINALIGDKLLPESARPCTGWPTIIKHDPLCSDPTLKVDPTHFSPLIDQLREWFESFTNQDTSGTEKDGTGSENPNFESEALPETSVKVESVNRTLEVINDLIHLSCVLAFPGMCGSTAFPTLYFNFQGIGSNLQNTEFIDLPGFDNVYLDNVMVEEIYRQVLLTCDGTILVVRATENILDYRQVVECIERTVRRNAGKPLVVVCTGVESHYNGSSDERRWGEDDTERLGKLVFRDPTLGKTRIRFCSPPLYRSAQYLMQQLEEATVKGTKLNFLELKRTEGRMYLNTEYGGSRFMKYLTPEDLRSDLSHSIDKSAISALPGFLRDTLQVEVRDVRYMSPMDDLHRIYGNLCRILHASSVNKQLLDDNRKQCMAFEKESASLLAQWKLQIKGFMSETVEKLNQKLTTVNEDASSGIERAIREVASLHKVKKAAELADWEIRFDNREAAFKFLVEVDNAVKACLEKLQDRIISEVKKFAQEEWCRRIEVLVAFFKPMSQGPEEQSMEVISQLRDNVVSKLSEMSYTSLDVALNTFVANRMKDQNLSNKIFRFLRNPIKIFKTRKEASQEAMRAVELDQGEAEEFQTKSVRYLVPTADLETAAKCPISTKLWPFLKPSDKFRGLATLETPFNVPLDLVLSNYKNHALPGWQTMVANDSHRSLNRATEFSEGVGLGIVDDAIASRRRWLNWVESLMKMPPLEPEDEVMLILMQADFTAAYGAVDNLCEHRAGRWQPFGAAQRHLMNF